MTSCKLYQAEHFYGTGESFLFTFYPTFKVKKIKGELNFIKKFFHIFYFLRFLNGLVKIIFL